MSKNHPPELSEPDASQPSFATTLHVRDHCICLHLQAAARSVARRFDEALRPSGLTNGQFSLLMSLNRPQPPTMGEVAATLSMDRTTLTAMLKPVVRDGLVAFVTDEADGRLRRLSLLEAGRAALRRALPHWVETERAIDAELAEADHLRSELVKLR